MTIDLRCLVLQGLCFHRTRNFDVNHCKAAYSYPSSTQMAQSLHRLLVWVKQQKDEIASRSKPFTHVNELRCSRTPHRRQHVSAISQPTAGPIEAS